MNNGAMTSCGWMKATYELEDFAPTDEWWPRRVARRLAELTCSATVSHAAAICGIVLALQTPST